MEKEVTVWNKVMSAALAIPGVKVDRELFLRAELQQYCTKDEMEKAVINPVDVVSVERLDSVASSCINNHLVKVTALSTVAGLPGGFVVLGTIPADMAQYYWHTFVLAQKLAYLYGIPDLRDENGNLTETSQNMLTLFVGIMMGVAAANNAIREISKAFAAQVVKRLPQQALTKTAYYPAIKQVAKWIGISLTTKTFSKQVGKFIPFLGGLFSGVLTASTFLPAAKRLQQKLKEQMYDVRNFESGSNEYEDTIYTEVKDDTESTTDACCPEKIIILFMINLAKIGGNFTKEKETVISEAIEHSTLSEDDQLELAQALSTDKLLQIDFSVLQHDEVNSTKLIEQGAEILKTDNNITLAEKLYFKKIVKQLGFPFDDFADVIK